MSYRGRNTLLFLVILIAITMGFGCAMPKAYRMNPEFNTYCKNIKTYGVLKPHVEVCEISAGGVKEIRDDWCELGHKNVISALKTCLFEKDIKFTSFTIDKKTYKEIEDIRALYKAVSGSIRLHSYGPHVFPEKQKNFDYSIGSIQWILEKYDCDAVIMVYGSDEISTGGRKALMALGAIAGAFTGVVIMPKPGVTTLNVAVVDSSGKILWYGYRAIGSGYDFRDPDSTLKMVDSIIEDFPECQE